MGRLLLLSMSFSCGMACLRFFHTGSGAFLPLIWNLFLAYIPYFITSRLSSRPGWVSRAFIFLPVFGVWLLFIPNTFYILTDLFHLVDRGEYDVTPLWFDLALILSFAWNGLLLGVLSVRQMEKLLWPRIVIHGWGMKRRNGEGSGLLFVYPIMWLNALGIYIGRYLRYNSWDVITDPFDLFRDIAGMVFHPLRHHYAWDMVFCFSILLTLMYLMMKRISQALA
jgi:uncharacterized membrane protein